MAFTTKTANYTINAATDFMVFCNATGVAAGVTITLPPAAANAGRMFSIKAVNQNTGGSPNQRCFVTPIATSSSTTTLELDAPDPTATNINSGVVVMSDGTKWWLISTSP